MKNLNKLTKKFFQNKIKSGIPKKNNYDVIIVGGGHNGLISSNYLAKEGKKVLVVESRYRIGGAATSEELQDGYTFSRASYLLSLLRKTVIDELFEPDWQNKIKLHKRNPSSFTPTVKKDYLLMGPSESLNYKEISKFNKKDAENLPKYEAKLSELLRIISPILDKYPINEFSIKNALFLLNNLDFQNASITLQEAQSILTSSAASYLDQWFENDLLKGTLASDAVIGANVSPYSPGSSYVLLHHVMGELTTAGDWFHVEGGMGSISDYLAELALKENVDIHVDCPVSEIIVKKQVGEFVAKGIVLEDGTEIKADTVLYNTTDHVAFKQLISNKIYKDLPEVFQREFKGIDYEGVSTKFNLILNDFPKFKCLSHLHNKKDTFEEKLAKYKYYLQGTTHINSESMQTLHKSYLDCAASKCSKDPMIELIIPSVLDKTLTPPNSENLVAYLFVQWTPYSLQKGWTQAKKNAFINKTFKKIDKYAPGFSKSVIFKDVLFPDDLEKTFNLTGGNIFHGSLNLNCLYGARPMPTYNSHDTPIVNLFRCGSAAHPGGGVMGAPGRNCAKYLIETGKI